MADNTDPAPAPAAPAAPARPAATWKDTSPLAYTSIVLVAAAALLLLAGLIYAFAVADARAVESSERFRLLAQSSSPFVAALALAAIALIVHDRRRPGAATQVAATPALGAASMVSLLALLLALNGIVVDLTGDVGAMFKLSNVLGRLATVGIAAFALFLSAMTPARPVVGAGETPVHS